MLNDVPGKVTVVDDDGNAEEEDFTEVIEDLHPEQRAQRKKEAELEEGGPRNPWAADVEFEDEIEEDEPGSKLPPGVNPDGSISFGGQNQNQNNFGPTQKPAAQSSELNELMKEIRLDKVERKIDSVKQRASNVQAAYSAAIREGNVEKIDKLAMEKADLLSEFKSLKEQREKMEKGDDSSTNNQNPGQGGNANQNQEYDDSQLDPLIKIKRDKWFDGNKNWYGKPGFEGVTQVVMKYVDGLLANGHDPRQDEFYSHVTEYANMMLEQAGKRRVKSPASTSPTRAGTGKGTGGRKTAGPQKGFKGLQKKVYESMGLDLDDPQTIKELRAEASKR